jgi:hypothetical protein
MLRQMHRTAACVYSARFLFTFRSPDRISRHSATGRCSFVSRHVRAAQTLPLSLQNLALKKMKQPELTFNTSCPLTLFPALGPNDAPAAPLAVKIAFGQSSKGSNAQSICINYTKGLSDEQARECFPLYPAILSYLLAGVSYS